MSHYHTNCSIVHRPEKPIYNLNVFLVAYKDHGIYWKLIAGKTKPFPILQRKKGGCCIFYQIFITISCEPNTAHFALGKPNIFVPLFVPIVYGCFETFREFLYVFCSWLLFSFVRYEWRILSYELWVTSCMFFSLLGLFYCYNAGVFIPL